MKRKIDQKYVDRIRRAGDVLISRMPPEERKVCDDIKTVTERVVNSYLTDMKLPQEHFDKFIRRFRTTIPICYESLHMMFCDHIDFANITTFSENPKKSLIRRHMISKGCIFGSLVGDSLGVTSEFMPPEQVDELAKANPMWPDNYIGTLDGRYVAGEPTDDSELTVCLMNSIRGRKFYPYIFAKEILEWFNGFPKDVGTTVRGAIRVMRNRINTWHESGRTLWQEKRRIASNGSLMRLSPVPAVFHDDDIALFGTTILSSVSTHYSIEVLLSCIAFSYYCSKLINGGIKDDSDYLRIFRERLNYSSVMESMDDFCGYSIYFVSKYEQRRSFKVFNMIREDYLKGKGKEEFDKAYRNIHDRISNINEFDPRRDIPYHEMGYVVHTLLTGIWAVINSKSFEEGIQMVVRVGNDADTYGAVAGAMLGAKYGFPGIPDKYIEPLIIREKVNELIKSNLLSGCSGSCGIW